MSLIINVPVIQDNSNNTIISFLGDSKSNLVYITDFIKQINEYYVSIRKRKQTIRLDTAMSKKSFTESAIALEADLSGNFPDGILQNATKDNKGRITNISELCPTAIKTKSRGANKGTWMHKRLVLVLLSGIDGFIANKVQNILIEHDVFGTRNKFSSAHKLLGDAIEQNKAFPKNHHTYCNVNKVVKNHLEYTNINNIPVETLEKRKQITEELATLTKYGFLNDYYAIKEFVNTKVIEGELV
jgi:hypothetical protein